MKPTSAAASLPLYWAYAFGACSLGLALWLQDMFGPLTVDQVVFHLRFADGAAVHMGEVFFVTFAVNVLVVPLLVAAGLSALHGMALRAGTARALRAAGASITGVLGFVALAWQLSAFTWAWAYFVDDRFAAEFVDPQQVRVQPPAAPRNLLLIYVESLEAGYGNASVMGRDLLAPLRPLPGQSFDAYRQAPGTGWTIAAMVATQCGVPLSFSTSSEMRSEGSKTFLAGATCMGDLLRQNGYLNVFMGGAPLSFAGKGMFLRDHGYQEVSGRDEWEQRGARKEELNEWGLFDGPLYARALGRLKQLQAGGHPFNLTVADDEHPWPTWLLLAVVPATRRGRLRRIGGMQRRSTGSVHRDGTT